MYFYQSFLPLFFIACPLQAIGSVCFKEGLTWYADDVLDITPGVENMYDCQARCAADPACEAFTWYNPDHIHYPMLCMIFHTTMRQEDCRDCVSGPDNCTCSAEYGCDITGDNLVDTVPGVETEVECMELCYQEKLCEIYSWFDEGNVFKHFCFLFKTCNSQDYDCTDCFSGPPMCSFTTTWDPTTRPWTTKPADPTTRPWTTKPADPTTRPWTTKPAYATTKPADATTKPADATTKPADATTKPWDATTKPADATTKPWDATTKPWDYTTKPADATTKPADTTTKPADATTKPWDTTRP